MQKLTGDAINLNPPESERAGGFWGGGAIESLSTALAQVSSNDRGEEDAGNPASSIDHQIGKMHVMGDCDNEDEQI